MIAAIYARKSTDQSGVADEAKSVRRQIDHSRDYAQRKGWTVDESLIFVDDGISGAEFANRPGFVRLMTALKPRPQFQVLIMSEESRLGREAIETAYALKQLITAGVRVFFYLEDRERTLDSPTDKILLSLTAYADELEREKARQRVTDSLVRHARAGHVTGGRCFGYDNLEVCASDGRRSHVERRINESEAAIVRQIFGLCAEGWGYTRIAKALNAEGVPAPRPQQGRPIGWVHTSIYQVLHRPLYRGEVVWNRTKKRDRWGQTRRSDRPESEWLRQRVLSLQIVPDKLWKAAQDRLTANSAKFTASSIQRRRRDVDSQYLLPGFARCAVCGGGMGVIKRTHGRHRIGFYGCIAYQKRGMTVCANNLVIRMDRVDEAVLTTIGSDVLKPAVINAVMSGVKEAMKPANISRDETRRKREIAILDDEIGRLTEAIASSSTSLPTLLEAVQTRQRRRDELIVRLETMAATATQRDVKAIDDAVRSKLSAWRSLLTRQTQDGRELLREVLQGPIRFMPDGKMYRFQGKAALGRLRAGTASNLCGVPGRI
jgi:DNA invertase Pin-like site-specific DNA recombinase